MTYSCGVIVIAHSSRLFDGLGSGLGARQDYSVPQGPDGVHLGPVVAAAGGSPSTATGNNGDRTRTTGTRATGTTGGTKPPDRRAREGSPRAVLRDARCGPAGRVQHLWPQTLGLALWRALQNL